MTVYSTLSEALAAAELARKPVLLCAICLERMHVTPQLFRSDPSAPAADDPDRVVTDREEFVRKMSAGTTPPRAWTTDSKDPSHIQAVTTINGLAVCASMAHQNRARQSAS